MPADPRRFGVYTGKRHGHTAMAYVLETSDAVTHHVGLLNLTNRYVTYVLRHDLCEYFIVRDSVTVHGPDHPVNCIECLALGSDLPKEPPHV